MCHNYKCIAIIFNRDNDIVIVTFNYTSNSLNNESKFKKISVRLSLFFQLIILIIKIIILFLINTIILVGKYIKPDEKFPIDSKVVLAGYRTQILWIKFPMLFQLCYLELQPADTINSENL